MVNLKPACLLFLLLLSGSGLSAQTRTDTVITRHTLDKISLLPCTPVKNQYLSGTCWSYASQSFLESELLRKGKNPDDLSEMFLARHSWWYKIRLHLALGGGNCLTPGGQFHDVQQVLREQGQMPQSAYAGFSGSRPGPDHGILDTTLTRYVRSLVKKGITRLRPADSLYIEGLLRDHLGRPPARFTREGTTWTPPQYLREYLQLNPDDYLEITSYTHHPYYQPFVLENQYNFSRAGYMNVPLNDFMTIAEESLRRGYTLLWNGDVTDPGFDFMNGAAVLEGRGEDRTAWRQRTFADSSSYMDHMMHLVGLFADEKGHRWFYLKNSWGDGNELDGYMLMDENYFAVKTAALVVNREAIPVEIRNRLKE